MQCVILAGGLATRMRPLTDTIPKALIPVDGRPFVDHQLDWLAAHGVTRVVLSIGYRGDMLRDHVGDGGRWGLGVRVVDEGRDLRGTAGALRLALAEGALDDAFLVTYGDSFLPVDFGAVWRCFRADGRPALMTVFANAGRWDTSNVIYRPPFEPGTLGGFPDPPATDSARQAELRPRAPGGAGTVVLYDKHHRTRPAGDFDFIDYGLSALTRATIERLVPAAERADLADLFHRLSVDGQLAGLEATERFYEIGSPAGLEDFERWTRARS
jgi:NDP-sugar pyrophosphorylase family protein